MTIRFRPSGSLRSSFNTASGMRSHVTEQAKVLKACANRFQYRKRYEVTCEKSPPKRRRSPSRSFNTASGMRSHVTTRLVYLAIPLISFNTASGMRSHVTLCLGGRRNRRLKSWFWKTSSNPNMCSHFFGCHYIPREYVITPQALYSKACGDSRKIGKPAPFFRL